MQNLKNEMSKNFICFYNGNEGLKFVTDFKLEDCDNEMNSLVAAAVALFSLIDRQKRGDEIIKTHCKEQLKYSIMAFVKGLSGNPTGRPKGSRNKSGEGLRNLISDFLENRFESIVKDFEQLEPKDRLKVYTDLLQYGLPKLQSVSTATSFENLGEDQLNEIINTLIKKYEAA